MATPNSVGLLLLNLAGVVYPVPVSVVVLVLLLLLQEVKMNLRKPGGIA